MGPHEEFLELCAVSTSGDLTEEEQKKLKAHLAGCAECRQALKEFEAAVDLGVPFLASKLAAVPTEESAMPQRELGGFAALNGTDSEPPQKRLAFRLAMKRGVLRSVRECVTDLRR